MTVHELKCWPEFFAAVVTGVKPFEVRRHDRPFRVGDVLKLREYDPEAGGLYTGGETEKQVTSILCGPGFGIEDGYCVMGLANV